MAIGQRGQRLQREITHNTLRYTLQITIWRECSDGSIPMGAPSDCTPSGWDCKDMGGVWRLKGSMLDPGMGIDSSETRVTLLSWQQTFMHSCVLYLWGALVYCVSTLVFGSIGHVFESEHRLFSRLSESASWGHWRNGVMLTGRFSSSPAVVHSASCTPGMPNRVGAYQW